MRRAIALTAIVIAATLVAQPALAGDGLEDREAETRVETSADQSSVAAGASYTTGSGLVTAVNLGPDPFADCDVLAGLGREGLANLTGLVLPGDVADGSDEPAAIDAGPLYIVVFCNAAVIDFWEQTDPVPAGILDILARSARNRTTIVPPNPTFSPDGATIPFLTQLPTWLWMADDIWAPVSATASIPEINLVVTVTATPTNLVWNPGDGTPTINCGQGLAWTQDAPGAADVDPPDEACTHTYTSSAGVGDKPPFTTSTTVFYDVDATCTPAPRCTNLTQPGDIDITTQTDVSVIQIRGTLTE